MSLAEISKMPPAIQAQVAAQLGAFKLPPVSKQAPSVDSPLSPVKTSKNRIRQNAAGLNKTEQAFLERLRSNHGYKTVLSQAVTLKLGNGVRFTVDFIVPLDARVCEGEKDAVTLLAFETKGFLRDDANVKLKVAASLYPWIKFHLVTRKKGEWQIQEILP